VLTARVLESNGARYSPQEWHGRFSLSASIGIVPADLDGADLMPASSPGVSSRYFDLEAVLFGQRVYMRSSIDAQSWPFGAAGPACTSR